MAALLLPVSSSPSHSIFTQNLNCKINTKIPLTKPNFIPFCSPPPASLFEENSTPNLSKEVSTKSESSTSDPVKLPFRGCKACGKEEIERGCNGEGRVQGGIATVPGFGWWPIKAYRPCPGFLASGGRYRRRGQSMDEVAWGRTEREVSIVTTDETQSSTKKKSPKSFKK